MKLDITPHNQDTPRLAVEIRTDTIRHLLHDLREFGMEIGAAMGATGGRQVTMDNGTVVTLTQRAGSEPRTWHPGTCVAVVLDENWNSVRRYAIYPK